MKQTKAISQAEKVGAAVTETGGGSSIAMELRSQLIGAKTVWVPEATIGTNQVKRERGYKTINKTGENTKFTKIERG